MFNILLVEDDPVIGKTVEYNLKDEGFLVLWAKNIMDAEVLFDNNRIDIALLDIGLPDGNGLDLCQSLRKVNQSIPILILTATIEEESAVKSFEYGADDYIRKPFGMTELVARVKRHLKVNVEREEKIIFQDLELFPKKRETYCSGVKLDFNRREFDILEYMIRNPEKVISRSEFLDKLNMSEEVSDRAIDSHLSHIRSSLKKIDQRKHRISSVYGVGYKLEKR